MGQKNIGAYVDSGSLGLFVQQIIDFLKGAIAVTIHDRDGSLVWASPDEGDNARSTFNPSVRARIPGPGFCEKLDDQNLAYVFYLESKESDNLTGTLSVTVKSSHPVSFDSAHRGLKPVLTCLERQISINSELSTVRRISSEARDGLELLVRMDELDGSAGPQEILQSVLQLSAVHFGCKLAAVSLPRLSIQQAHPATALTDSASAKRLIAGLNSLNSSARKYKKVLVSNESANGNQANGSGKPASKILCSPVVNSKDEVAGIFVLIGEHALPKECIRLVRAICVKINSQEA